MVRKGTISGTVLLAGTFGTAEATIVFESVTRATSRNARNHDTLESTSTSLSLTQYCSVGTKPASIFSLLPVILLFAGFSIFPSAINHAAITFKVTSIVSIMGFFEVMASGSAVIGIGEWRDAICRNLHVSCLSPFCLCVWAVKLWRMAWTDACDLAMADAVALFELLVSVNARHNACEGGCAEFRRHGLPFGRRRPYSAGWQGCWRPLADRTA